MGVYALLSMLIDHAGAWLEMTHGGPPGVIFICRVLGRLAIPLYLFQASRVYEYKSAAGIADGYLVRLFVLASVSEVPYRLFFGSGGNYIFVILSVLMIEETRKNGNLCSWFVLVVLAGLGQVLCWYLFYAAMRRRDAYGYVIQGVLLYLSGGGVAVAGLGYLALLSMPEIKLSGWKKRLYRYAYPLHLFIGYCLT